MFHFTNFKAYSIWPLLKKDFILWQSSIGIRKKNYIIIISRIDFLNTNFRFFNADVNRKIISNFFYSWPLLPLWHLPILIITDITDINYNGQESVLPDSHPHAGDAEVKKTANLCRIQIPDTFLDLLFKKVNPEYFFKC